MNSIQSKDHRIGAYEINKSFFDDKVYIQNNECEGLALGYLKLIIKKQLS